MWGVLRKDADPFDLGLDAKAGTRICEESFALAQEMTTVLGQPTLVVDRYLSLLAGAQPSELKILKRRDARIVFAPTVPHALDSKWAAERRGRSLTREEALDIRSRYSPEQGVAAVFDPETDALILPTAVIHRDLEQVVFHELGHALTLDRAEGRVELLDNLPREISQHLGLVNEAWANHPDRLKILCQEALADAYAFTLVGREDEIPPRLMSELMFILTSVSDESDQVRFEFDPESGRTASRVKKSEMVDADDPEFGHLLAERPQPDEQLEAVDLIDDELAVRRQRRAA
jgi:hypothetical protein